MRTTFVKVLIRVAEEDPRIVLITPDLGVSVLEEFEEKFPTRFLNVGIAEQNAVGVAAGMALSGKIVFVYSIIPFVTMRPFEQIRNDCAYMNTNVRLVGVGAGLTYGAQGATHHSTEDISLMRSLPNMAVVVPSDPYELEKILEDTVHHQGPIYFRLPKNGEPVISIANSPIHLGKANYLVETKDSQIAILFTGNASDIALEVTQRLKEDGHGVDLVSIHTIKPFDYAALENLLITKKYIYTLEEHSIFGGLGSVVAEYIAESSHNPVFKRFGLPDTFSHYVGSQHFIRSKVGFTSSNVYEQITEDTQ
jgi:transketolase